ncbi:glutamine-rich protein 2 [Pteronotus mesoamericanus]|uniref:glutamine-rich protein 2 n=1 Tax=Pteronotus mesoamericanus TaxID=1884717 RepID=UPI0023EAFA2F|nr:glutamine-rich protein 2 [Pteronotus parnellii mesoamericanus]
MPPATPSTSVSLRELADLAIGTPEVGAVNFTALHTLVVAMLKKLHLQDTKVDFQTLSPEQSRSFEGPRASLSIPQVAAPKEKRKSSMARMPAQMLEVQVKDLGGQVQDLGQQFKTMDSQVQGILNHMQYFTALVGGLDADPQEWLGKSQMTTPTTEMATPTTEMATPTARMATPTARMATPTADVAMPATGMATSSTEKTKLEMATLMPRMDKPTLGIATAASELSMAVPSMATVTPEKARMGLMKIWKDSPQAMELLQNVVEDVKTLKEAQKKVQESPELNPQTLLQRIEKVERIVRDREEVLEPLSRKLTLTPAGEEITMVTWEELEHAIKDGWKALQGGSESTTGLVKRKRKTSLSSNDMIPSGAATKSSSVDKGLDSAGSLGPDQVLPGASGSGRPSEGVLSRERGRHTSAAGFPGREQHPRARDEASPAKTPRPSEPQLRVEPDHHRPGEQLGLVHPRRDEQEGYPRPVQQDLASARGGHQQVSPDPRRGEKVGLGQAYARPDQHGSEPPDLDQLELLQPRTHPHGVFPFSTSQLGMMPPGMVGQESVLPGMGQHDVVPPWVPGREQQGLALPSMEQPGMVPLSTHQRGVRLPGTDQRGMAWPGMDESGMGPFGIDQHGFAIFGVDQQGLVLPLADQRGLESPGLMQAVTEPQGFVRLSSEMPGFIQPGTQRHDGIQASAGQPGLVQLGLEQGGLAQLSAYPPGWIQPDAYPFGLVQPGMDQRGLVQPGMDQQGFVQPGMDQHDLVQPGMDQQGLFQPGAGQPGLVQPGTIQPGLVQPGAGQPGLVQPGAGQPGLVQPGTIQPGLVQPDAGQPGLVQPGTIQPGLVQPGAGQPGLVQPGTIQPGLVQPGTIQPGLVQPGAGQPGLVQPGTIQPGLVQPGAGQPGLVQPGTVQPGLVQPGAGQPGLVQPGTIQPDLVQPGTIQPGLVQPGAGQPGLVQPGTIQPGLVQPGAGQPGLVQPGTIQPGLVQPGTGQPGLVQPGTIQPGLVQPGAGQPGLVQPGTIQPGLVQPGVGQPGLVQPGTIQPGLVQPGAGQPGLVQPGTYPRSLVQPGAYPRGLVPRGAYPHGLVQPGVYPHGFMQPGTEQRGLVQPGIDQRGLRQPGADHRRLAPSGPELHGFPLHWDSPSFGPPRPYQHGMVPPGRDQHSHASPLLAKQGLVSPGIDHEGLVPTETYQHGLLPPGTDQHGPTPLSTDVESAQSDQQHLVSPAPDQRGQAHSIPDSHGLMYPGPHGPGYPYADQYVQVGLYPHQPGVYSQTLPHQDTASFRSTDNFNHLYQVSPHRSDIEDDRENSLDRVAPSFPIAVETLRLMGELISLYMEIKDTMKDLDEQKAGQTDLEKFQYLFSRMVQKTIPPDLQEQLKNIKTLTKEVRQEKAKVEKIQKILQGEEQPGTGKEMKGGQLSLQLGTLRVTVADIEKELAELRESQERGKVSMEHSVSEASLYLQDQLDKLRTIIESMLASSSTLLTMSMPPQKAPITLVPGEIDPEATCPACSLDVSHQVSTLVRRYEQLQNMVNGLAASRPSKKAKLQSQDEELLGHVQRAILQVQGDCEKLNITTSNLIADHQQKQKDIEALYQGLQKLEREKANREHLEMEIDVKADKSALAAKVSRVQFDATTEQLNHMMQELVAKMSGQEQDWQKVLDRLLTEMDSKLDRLELDPVKQSLEDRWKSLRQQLKERPPLYQADEAACMRRQLLAHFHCLSCDRPLDTPVTGQLIPVTPVGPSLPGNRSTRPYTIFELEQVRQQSRSLKLGSATFSRADLAPMERSVGRLHTMHSKMLMDIEKVQIHFGGSVKASSQMIRELLQAQCLSSPCYKRVPDMADYTYSTAPRPCGGSHTLTYPYRRVRLQHLPQGLHPEEIQLALKHDEVDILGLDGHIYKGRMDTRLPGIPSKDSSGVIKHKAKPPRPHVHRQPSLSDSGRLPSRPQSAETLAGNTPATSRPRTERPVSSQGRLSQPLSPSEVPAGPEMHMDVPPGEGLEEPTRGPRSSTAH